MSPSEYTSISFFKESNKLVGTNNSLAWKKRIGLLLKENELLEHVKGNISIPTKEQTQALEKYNKDEIRAQILIELIKYSLIPYVSKFETLKEIYDKLVELFLISTTREIIYMWNELYKMKIRREIIIPYFMKISQMRYHLQDLGEVMSDIEMTTLVLNALPKDWGNFKSSIYSKKEATTLFEMWSLCRTKETILKEKEECGIKGASICFHGQEKGKKFQIWSTKNKQQRHVQNPMFWIPRIWTLQKEFS